MGRDRSHLWELGGQMATGFSLAGSLDLNLHLLQKSCRNNISTTGLESCWKSTPVVEDDNDTLKSSLSVSDYSFISWWWCCIFLFLKAIIGNNVFFLTYLIHCYCQKCWIQGFNCLCKCAGAVLVSCAPEADLSMYGAPPVEDAVELHPENHVKPRGQSHPTWSIFCVALLEWHWWFHRMWSLIETHLRSELVTEINKISI